jgi:ketosteroid isomerase-like protein
VNAHVLAAERDTARAMSQENVEIVRRLLELFDRADYETGIETWAPDAILDWSASHGPFAGVYRGRAEIRAFRQQFTGTFDEVRLEPELEGAVEVESDALVVETVGYFRGRDGIEVQARSAWLIRFRDHKVAELTLYQTKQEALEAVGLRE